MLEGSLVKRKRRLKTCYIRKLIMIAVCVCVDATEVYMILYK
jgi:hypothetical protein